MNFRYFFCFFLFVQLSVFSVNLIENGDIESGTTGPDGWTFSGVGLGDSVDWATDHVQSGSRSLKIVNASGGNIIWQGATVNLESISTKAFTFKVSSKSSGVTVGANYFMKTKVTFMDLSYAWITGPAFPTGTNDWETLEVHFHVEKNPGAPLRSIKSIEPYLYLTGGTGTVWFDDISITPYKPVEPKGNVVRNFNAEEGAFPAEYYDPGNNPMTIMNPYVNEWNSIDPPSMADSIGAQDWWSYGGSGGNTFEWAVDEKLNGQRSLKIVNSTGANMAFVGKEIVFPDTGGTNITDIFTITAKASSKSLNVVGASDYRFGVLVTLKNGSRIWQNVGSFTQMNNGWETVEDTINFSDHVKRVQPYLVFHGGSGTAWFDDISIVPLMKSL